MPTGVYDHEVKVTHGHNRKGKTTPEYRAYYHAKDRCQNPKDKGWKYYGERGIQFKFKSFKEFIMEVGLRPSKQHSLDRIKNNGHYEVGNVRWATKVEQMRNCRNSIPADIRAKVLEYKSQGQTYVEISNALEIPWESAASIIRQERLTPLSNNKLFCYGIL